MKRILAAHDITSFCLLPLFVFKGGLPLVFKWTHVLIFPPPPLISTTNFYHHLQLIAVFLYIKGGVSFWWLFFGTGFQLHQFRPTLANHCISSCKWWGIHVHHRILISVMKSNRFLERGTVFFVIFTSYRFSCSSYPELFLKRFPVIFDFSQRSLSFLCQFCHSTERVLFEFYNSKF